MCRHVFGVVLVWLPFVRGFSSGVFRKRPFMEWVGRGGSFFFGLFSWLVWSLGGGKGRDAIRGIFGIGGSYSLEICAKIFY